MLTISITLTFWGGAERIDSFHDVFVSQYRHYFEWGGRVIVHAIGQTFLWWGKPVFDVCNTLAYIALLLVVYFHAVGRLVWRPLLLFALNFFIFLFTPAFGEDFLWLIGAVNYLWGPLLMLSFLLLYRMQLGRRDPLVGNPVGAVLLGMLGILGGWTNENTAVALVVMIGFFLYFYWREYRRIYLWAAVGLAAAVVGAALCIAAPGNFVRLDVRGGTTFHVDVIANFFTITRYFLADKFLLVPLGVTGILVLLTTGNKKTDWRVPAVYGLGLLASMYSMIASPYFPDRAKSGCLLIALCLAGYFYTRLDLNVNQTKRILAVAAVVMISSFVSQYNVARKDIGGYKIREEAVIAHILAEKEKGVQDVVVPANYAFTRYCAGGRNGKLSSDPEHWVNQAVARYYGIRSLRTESNPIKPPAGV